MSWQTLVLEELASVQRGKFSARPRNDPKYYGGHVPFIQTGDVANGAGRVRSYSQTLNSDGLSVSKLFPKGSLVVTIAANIGDVARVDFDFACPDSLVVVRANEGVDGDWLQYGLESKKELLDSLAPQNAQKNINLEVLRPLSFDVPPLREQQRIAGALATWDTAIQKTEQLIAGKERHEDALVQRLYALSDNRGSSSRFGDLLEESMEAGSSGRHARKITVKLYGKGVLAKEERRRGSEQTQYFVRRAGQLIYSKLDFLNGAFGLIPPDLDGYESTLDLPAFDIAPTVNPIWLIGYLTRPTYYTHQVGLARGQRKARRVHPSDLLASCLQVPPRDLQDRIAEILLSSKRDIDKSKLLLESLKIQKRGLMQKLLTGEWRLPIPEEASA